MAITIKAVVLNEKGEVLLIKRGLEELNGGKYDLPGGHIEKNETIEEALIREIKEETGLDAKKGEIIDAVEFSKDHKLFKEEKRGLRYIYYTESEEIQLSDEHYSADWFSLDDAIENLNEKDGFENEKRETILKAKELLERKSSMDGWKRALADLENFKKRTTESNAEFRQYCIEDFVIEVLPVIDNFDLSLEHVPEGKENDGWTAGILHIRKQLADVLEGKGVVEIECKSGDKIDETIHEVIVGDGKKGKVKKVIKKGYKLNEKLIRPVGVEGE
jgi:molecular chaperone GrpE